MGVPARAGAVVRAVPLARARTAAYAVVALAGLGVYAAEAGGGLSAALGAAIVGAVWTALMLWMRNQVAGAPPPLPTAEQDLPPAAAVWRVLTRDTALYAIFVAVGVGVALSMRQDFIAGLVLGLPVMSWAGQRAAERTERELNGTLWRPAGFTFRADPVRYLSRLLFTTREARAGRRSECGCRRLSRDAGRRNRAAA